MAKFNKYKAYKYDSKWEEALTKGIMKDFDYHPKSIEYIKPETNHKYTPDWILNTFEPVYNFLGKDKGYHKTIYIEAKGRFRSREEMQKYIWIKDSLSDDEELVFLFQKPRQPVFGVKARKDGTKMSHAEFAEKHGIRWFSEDTIKELLSE